MSKFFKIKKAAVPDKLTNNMSFYYVKSYFIDVNKDSWEHGETDRVADFSQQDDATMMNKGFDSILKAANSVLEAYYCNPINDKSKWIIEKDGYDITCQTTVTVNLDSNNDFYEVYTNSEEYQQFKNGEIDLYAMVFVITIGKRQEIEIDDSEI